MVRMSVSVKKSPRQSCHLLQEGGPLPGPETGLLSRPSSYLSYVSSGQTWCKMWKIIRKVERVSFTGDYLGMFPLVHTMDHEKQVSINAMFEMGVIFLQLFLNPAAILLT